MQLEVIFDEEREPFVQILMATLTAEYCESAKDEVMKDISSGAKVIQRFSYHAEIQEKDEKPALKFGGVVATSEDMDIIY